MRNLALAGIGLLFLSVTACVPRPEAPPPPLAPEPAPPPPPPPAPPPSPAPSDWRDVPLTPGDWSYSIEGGASVAAYSAEGNPVFMVRCDPGRQISLLRPGVAAQAMTVRTTFSDRSLPATPQGTGSAASLSPNDPLLDQIAFSRGRFLVQTAGATPLFLPAWPEPARVVEECRG
ncbi:hypothetical protein RCO27_17625 [Sphingosinicella sp. LHD-64]|uniref:hypothetical protein n=1 Tax=Sphingosinicella sp. LHD-64 TaxID=3072139 RepID=UPI0028108E43|nr:hypothetical protein [Sphingosinicella sp. LHD-64]MDQ8758050.1 hypothetical protein [Sphingosinicella sp. LHD-64]